MQYYSFIRFRKFLAIYKRWKRNVAIVNSSVTNVSLSHKQRKQWLFCVLVTKWCLLSQTLVFFPWYTFLFWPTCSDRYPLACQTSDGLWHLYDVLCCVCLWDFLSVSDQAFRDFFQRHVLYISFCLKQYGSYISN